MSMKLKSGNKRKNMTKAHQEFENENEGCKWISEAHTKINSDVEEMEINPSTLGFAKEVSVKESMGTTSIQQPETPVVKNTYAHAKSFETAKWRRKTRLTK